MNRKLLLIAIISTTILSSAFIPWHYGPDHFPAPYLEVKQIQDHKKVELGRQLFYDPILSRDSTISCASCHAPFNAFAHTDHDLSHGINDSIGTRNAPALFNLAWHKQFMWDGAVNHLEVQALAPIEHPGEMAENLKHIQFKLNRSNHYKKLFGTTYTDGNITGERILKCLTEFQLSLISANSKYDSVIKGQSTYTDQEKKGYRLFRQHCNSCHKEPLFSSFEFANNGLPFDSSLNDYGRYTVTKLSEDSLLFKIPTLRNLKFTYPYMHDGRFTKLRQVLNHYSNGIVSSPSLAHQLKGKIRINAREKTELISFLLTLDDQSFVFDKTHSFPKFRK